VPTPGIDFFRVDRSGSTRRLLAIAGVLVALGATTAGAHLVRRLADLGRTIALLGGVTMLAGLVLGFGTMAMMLFENVWLSIRAEGLLVHENGRETILAWDDLTTIETDAGFVVLSRPAGDAVRWYAGREAEDVAARILEARRKASLGVLRVGT
jgi:hypothetical protein